MLTRSILFSGVAALLLTACLGSGGGGSSTSSGGGGTTALTCQSPLPPVALDQSITENIPSDFDATANPAPTTTIFFTIMLPERCPNSRFPVVLQSHGYGGTRLKTLAANGDLHPSDPHFPSINELVQALPYHGYVVISYDERGHGDSTNANARIIDPNAEVQDARGILDWAYDNATLMSIQTEPNTGIAKDIRVGTIGYSYGGGFEMSLAALDSRIDTIVPNGTWNNLLYSLLPGDGVKLSYDGLLCLLASTGNVSNTPLIQTLCNQVGVQGGPAANTLRTRSDLEAAISGPTASPRAVSPSEVNPFFFTRGARYFEEQQLAGLSFGFPGNHGPLRKVPALFLQGNRDVLFNMTEQYWNARYFGSTGADVRAITTEGGHMNPLANQTEGPANCGKVIGVESILAWFDHYLKGVNSAAFTAIPKVCISVADTTGAPAVTPVGLKLNSFPVGSLTGTGAVPAILPTLSSTAVGPGAVNPVFVPVITISGNDKVLAGIPRIASLTVAPGTPSVQTAVAYVGVGIVRGGNTILVDDEVTPFIAGTHAANRGEDNSVVLLPGVGEQLKDGDQVGLLFYEQHVQYAAIVSAASFPNATNVVNTALGTPIPPITTALGPEGAALQLPNPYTVTATNVELPILVPGQYAGSSLSQ